jgi:hypothetical protein
MSSVHLHLHLQLALAAFTFNLQGLLDHDLH